MSRSWRETRAGGGGGERKNLTLFLLVLEALQNREKMNN